MKHSRNAVFVANTKLIGEITMKSSFEQNGGTYRPVNGYRIPNLTIPNDELGEEAYIGIWGQRRLEYLRKHRRLLYMNLRTSSKLRAHLYEIDVSAHERCNLIIEQMVKAQGVTEQLKAENQMLWVGRMNSIRACAEDIIRNEMIYQ